MLQDDPDQLSLFHPAAAANPYPLYHRLRAADPVHWDGRLGSWVLTRYGDVLSVLRDPRFLAARTSAEWLPPEFRPLGEFLALWMLFQDPPSHTRLRGLVSKAFTPRVVENLRPRVQRLVDEALDAALARGGLDIIGDLAVPLPTTVIAELLGVPLADQAQFKRWSTDLVAFISPSVEDVDRIAPAYASLQALIAYLQGIVAARRRQPRDDLLSRLIAVNEQGDALTEPEMYATCVLLLVAGHETTTNLIGNGMLALLRHPDQLRRLQADPALITGAVEELLRFDGPIQFTDRLAGADVTIDSRAIEQGQSVTVVLGAANRDPAQFADPDRLDLGRADKRHVAFAHGPHFCLGAPLARLEGQIAIGTLVRRLPSLRLATGAVTWHDNLIFHGVTALPVTF